MAAINELGVPATGAINALPSQATPQPNADVEAFTSSAGSLRRGVRSGANSVGAMLNGIIGQTAESLGLSEFAADRFADAQNFVSMAESVDPIVKDIGQVKDLNTLANFTLGHVGKGLATAALPLAAGIGLRRPVAGVMAGSFPQEAGEQVLSLRDDPEVMRSASSKDVLKNAVGKGLATSALETIGAPGQAVKRVLSPQKAVGGLGKTIAKATVGEGLTEGAQEIIGDVSQQQLNPAHKVDPHQVLNAAAAGAVGGGAIGGGAHLASSLPGAISKAATNVGELRQRLGKKDKPVDPNTDLPPDEVKTDEDVLAWLEGGEKTITDKMTGMWDTVKNNSKFKSIQEFVNDPDSRSEFMQKAKDEYNSTEVAPKIKSAMTTVKTYASGFKKYIEKKNPNIKLSEDRTRLDDDIHEEVLKSLPQDISTSAKPEDLLKLSDMFKKIVQEPEYFEESGAPRTLRKMMGDEFPLTLRRVAERMYSSKDEVDRAMRVVTRTLTKGDKTEDTQLEGVQNVIRNHLRPEYLANPELRNTAMDVLAPKMLDFLHGKGDAKKTAPEFDKALYEAFGEKSALVMEKLDKVMDVHDEQPGYDAGAEPKNVYDYVGRPIKTAEGALSLLDEASKKYGDDAAGMTIKATEDGRYMLDIPDSQATGLTQERVRQLKEDPKYRKAGIRVQITGDEAPVTVNPVKLTSEMMRREDQQTKEGGAKYVWDMFSRGVSKLLSTDGVKLVGSLDFKDDMPVGYLGKDKYTWGDIKKYKISRMDLKGITKEDIERHKEIAEKAMAAGRRFKLSPEATRIAAINAAIDESHEKAFAQTMLDPREDIEQTVDDGSRPTLASRDPEGDRHQEEDTKTPLNERRTFTTETVRTKARGEEKFTGDVSTGIKAPAFAEPTKKTATAVHEKSVFHTNSTTDKLIAQVQKDLEAAKPGLKIDSDELRRNLNNKQVGDSEFKKWLDDLFPGPKTQDISNAVMKARQVYDDIKVQQAKASPMPAKASSLPLTEAQKKAAAELVKKGPKFSTMNVGKGPVTPEQRKEVRAYVEKVLGKDKTKVLFRKLAHAGEFANLDGVETLKIAVDAIDPMSVGYHEAMHAFFARLVKADPKAAHVLLRAAGSAPVVARLNELLKGHPNAIAQLKDPEEALSYMYQFWAKGEKDLLPIGPETKTWFDKVKLFFKAIAAVWADDMTTELATYRAGQILDAFHNGEFANRNTVAEVMRDKFPEDAQAKLARIWPGLSSFMDRFVWTSTGAVRDMNIPALTEIMDKFAIDTHSTKREPGFLQARHVETNKYVNRVTDILGKLNLAEQRSLLDEMRSGNRTSAPAKELESILNELFDYMNTAGVETLVTLKNGKKEWQKVERIKHNYFPRVPDMDYLRTTEGMNKFIQLLSKYKVDDPLGVWKKYTVGIDAGKPQEALDLTLGLSYFTPQTSKRSLAFIPDKELAPFLNKDIFGTMSQYISRAVRRSEYTRRFGNTGENIRDAIETAKKQGLTKQQEQTFDEVVKALDGSIGANMSDTLKGFYSALTTYQNIRLLPLALFSSLVDPGGIAVRGGTAGEAFGAFWRGIKNLTGLKQDDAYMLAKTVGSISAAHDSSMIGDMYGSQYMPKLQRTINDKFFKYNGMESWNNSMRISATAAAEQFIIRHATKKNDHSDRYLAELGLTDDDVKVYNGRLQLDDKVIKAINLWVDEAILRPNAAQRPVYMSDPNWMLISHLKQYTYLFQKTILARVNHELQNGNYSPAMALAGYVPAIIAVDMLRIALTPGDNDDIARKNWGPSDWLWRGIQRAGLFGPGQMVLDTGGDAKVGKTGFESVLGPQVEQIMDFVRASMQGTGMQGELIKAIPGSRIFR